MSYYSVLEIEFDKPVFVIILFVIDKRFSRKTSKREHPDWYYDFRNMDIKIGFLLGNIIRHYIKMDMK